MRIIKVTASEQNGSIEVVNPGFQVEPSLFNVVPGDTFSIGIDRTATATTLSGKYQVYLPESWQLAGYTEFEPGQTKNQLTVTVPKNVDGNTFDIYIYPVSGGNYYGALKVTAQIVKPYSIEILPVQVQQGNWNKWMLGITMNNNASTTEVKGTLKVLAPSEWASKNSILPFDIKAGGTQKFELKVPNNPGQSLYNLRMEVILDNGDTEVIDHKVSFLGAVKAKKAITADGIISESEWKDAMPFTLDNVSQYVKPDAKTGEERLI